MIRRNIFAVVLLLLASLGGFSMAGAAESQAGKDTSGTCDRECLRGFITQYLDAISVILDGIVGDVDCTLSNNHWLIDSCIIVLDDKS